MDALPPIVTAAWVADRLDQLVLADVRQASGGTSGRDLHLGGHLPGAVHVDVDADLAAHGAPTDGRHPLPTPEAFAAAMQRLGIGETDTVVAYDAGDGGFAARLVWMLRVTGHRAALLSGGLAGWPGEVEEGPVRRAPARFTPTPWPTEAIVDGDEVAALAADPTAVVIDARAAARYRGEVEPFDPQAGHVPGAVNVPYGDNTDADGRFLDEATLRRRYAEVGADRAATVAVYCGSGVTACHDVLALEAIGITARLYPGSWSAWSNDPARPVATGEAP